MCRLNEKKIGLNSHDKKDVRKISMPIIKMDPELEQIQNSKKQATTTTPMNNIKTFFISHKSFFLWSLLTWVCFFSVTRLPLGCCCWFIFNNCYLDVLLTGCSRLLWLWIRNPSFSHFNILIFAKRKSNNKTTGPVCWVRARARGKHYYRSMMMGDR